MILSVIQRHLYSSLGEAGLVDLLARTKNWAEPLKGAWQSRNEVDGFVRLFDVLTDTITDVDRIDLRTQQIRLRPLTGGTTPVGVIGKLARTLIDCVVDSDALAARKAFEALLAAGGSVDRFDVKMGFRVALAEILIEEGSYDSAVDLIETNLAVNTFCPDSQYLLYRALIQKKQSGMSVSSRRINLDDLSDRFCEQPFQTISTSPPPVGKISQPPAYACSCPGMLLYPLAGSSSDEAENFQDIWNGPEITEIRRSILEGDFTYCNRTMCGRLLQSNLPKRDEITDPVMRDIIDNKREHLSTPPRLILLGHDASCNIACPTCRPRIITANRSMREVMDQFVDRIILPLMEDADVSLIVAGDGDPIGSKHYRKLLQSLHPERHRGVGLNLLSNGQLITAKEWASLSNIHHLVKSVSISIDAAVAETYEDVRRPGKWNILMENMDFIANLRREGKIDSLIINFVVQKKNFEEMPAFVELGQRWSADRVFFNKLFSTFHPDSLDPSGFKANAVVDEDHPDHQRFLEVLKHPLMRSKEVDLYNIAPYLGALSGSDATPSVDVDEAAPPGPVQARQKKRGFWTALFRRNPKRDDPKSSSWFDSSQA